MQAVRNISASIQYWGLRIASARVKSRLSVCCREAACWGASFISMPPTSTMDMAISPHSWKVASSPLLESSSRLMYLKPRLPRP
ncbi:hypothetical protein D3C72_1167390 [compost metagenome]